MNLNKKILFSLPAVFFGAILLYFVLWNLYYSFRNSSLLVIHSSFVGFSTFSELFSFSIFKVTLIRSLIWSGSMIVLGNIMGILMALLIFFSKSNAAKNVYSSIFIYPLAVSTSATAVIWTWLFNYQQGINMILVNLHLPAYPWLDKSYSAFPSLIIVTMWVFSGLAAIFYYAAFQNVNRETLESARVDAAGPFRIAFRILLPEAKNAFIVATALIFLFTLRIFTIPYVSTGLNPFTETAVIATYYYYIDEFFSVSSAYSIIIVIIAIAVIIPYALYGIKRWIAS